MSISRSRSSPADLIPIAIALGVKTRTPRSAGFLCICCDPHGLGSGNDADVPIERHHRIESSSADDGAPSFDEPLPDELPDFDAAAPAVRIARAIGAVRFRLGDDRLAGRWPPAHCSVCIGRRTADPASRRHWSHVVEPRKQQLPRLDVEVIANDLAPSVELGSPRSCSR